MTARPLPPAFDRRDVVTRPMTADEARMVRELACCSLLAKHPERGSWRLVHARSLTPGRWITEHEAKRLRAFIIAFAAKMPADVVEMAKAGAR